MRSLREDHLGVLMGSGHLAQVYARTDRLDKAERLSLDIIRKIQPSRGTAHPDCVYAFWKLAQLYQLKGAHEKAIECCEMGLERADMRITREHPLSRDLEQLLDRLRAASCAVDSDAATLAESNQKPETASSTTPGACHDMEKTNREDSVVGSDNDELERRFSRNVTW